MTLKVYLTGISLAAVLALVSFILLVSFFLPENVDATLLILIYLSLFIFLSGLFSLAGFFIRKRIYKNQPAFLFLGISFRQGILLAFLSIGSLVLHNFNIFWWWSGIALLILIGVIEFVFLRMQK